MIVVKLVQEGESRGRRGEGEGEGDMQRWGRELSSRWVEESDSSVLGERRAFPQSSIWEGCGAVRPTAQERSQRG